jgi:hypothetical protein
MTTELTEMKVTDLKEIARDLNISGWGSMKKADLIDAIQAATKKGTPTSEPEAAPEPKPRQTREVLSPPEVAQIDWSEREVLTDFPVAQLEYLAGCGLMAMSGSAHLSSDAERQAVFESGGGEFLKQWAALKREGKAPPWPHEL